MLRKKGVCYEVYTCSAIWGKALNCSLQPLTDSQVVRILGEVGLAVADPLSHRLNKG